MLAHGTASILQKGVESVLLLAAVVFALIALSRLRGQGFKALPVGAGWTAAALAGASVVLAFVAPHMLGSKIATVRPRSDARVTIITPIPGQVLHGDPATVRVRLRLVGGRIVSFTSSRLTSSEGHIHMYVDGRLVLMAYDLVEKLDVPPGPHTLRVEFVALDHGPFDPRVQASVSFRVLSP